VLQTWPILTSLLVRLAPLNRQTGPRTASASSCPVDLQRLELPFTGEPADRMATRCSVAGPAPPDRGASWAIWPAPASWPCAVELVGAAATASDPGLRAELALAECAI
jgi:hypothetical protein